MSIRDWELAMSKGESGIRSMSFNYHGVRAEFITAEISYAATRGQSREEILGKVVEYLYDRRIYQYPNSMSSNKPLLVLVREDVINSYPASEFESFPKSLEKSFKTPKPNTKLLLL